MNTVKINLKSGRSWTFTKTEFDLNGNVRTINDGGCLIFQGHSSGTKVHVIPADAIESIEITREA